MTRSCPLDQTCYRPEGCWALVIRRGCGLTRLLRAADAVPCDGADRDHRHRRARLAALCPPHERVARRNRRRLTRKLGLVPIPELDSDRLCWMVCRRGTAARPGSSRAASSESPGIGKDSDRLRLHFSPYPGESASCRKSKSKSGAAVQFWTETHIMVERRNGRAQELNP
jgi:hypothetical protein